MAYLAVLNVLTALALALVQHLWATVEHIVTHVVMVITYQELFALVIKKKNITFPFQILSHIYFQIANAL